jgi:serine/threonine protein kinase
VCRVQHEHQLASQRRQRRCTHVITAVHEATLCPNIYWLGIHRLGTSDSGGIRDRPVPKHCGCDCEQRDERTKKRRETAAGTMAALPNSVTSLPYTAPEVILIVKRPVRGVPASVATTAADVWALGIIAFELLTNERVFADGAPSEAIRRCLEGHSPLPWEDGASGSERRRQKLRGLRRIVMPCLNRDPRKRPSALKVLQLWWHVFELMKTQGTFESNPA